VGKLKSTIIIGKIRRHAKVPAVIIAAFAVAGLVWWGTSVLGLGNKVLPETTAHQIEASMDELLEKLTPGTVLHVKMQVFNRHNPAASEVNTIPWVMPETTVGDIWMGPVDDDGIFTDYKVTIQDVAGNIVQEVTRVGEEVVYRDIRNDEENRSPWVPWSAAGFLQGTADKAQRLLEEGWNWVSSGTWDGQETVIFEKLLPWDEPAPQEGVGSIAIPYMLDLRPREILRRIEIVLDNPLVHSEQTWVIGEQGNRILVWEERWTIVEVLH